VRTTINLPDGLINEAMKLSKCRTKTALFKLALENIIQKEKIAGIKQYRGKLDLEIDLNETRER
jgi:hypothetical protein